MRTTFCEAFVVAALSVLCTASLAAERTMGVTHPPETVFDVPVDEIVPELAGASPTGANGRVGGELVFWGYRLADGRDAEFFACALIEGVDCDARIAAICPAGTRLLASGERAGTVVRRRCREISFANPGDVRPGCTDRSADTGLRVGLVACN